MKPSSRPPDGIAKVCDLLTAAAELWIASVEDEQPTSTLSNRFLAEAEACYFAACKDSGRSGYRDMTEDWE